MDWFRRWWARERDRLAELDALRCGLAVVTVTLTDGRIFKVEVPAIKDQYDWFSATEEAERLATNIVKLGLHVPPDTLIPPHYIDTIQWTPVNRG